MKLSERLTAFPFFRWARYAALAIIAAALVYFSLTCYEWRTRRNFVVFVIPLGFIVNALSVEIIFARLRRKADAGESERLAGEILREAGENPPD